MTVHPSLPEQFRKAESKEMKKKNVKAENLGRSIKPIFKICSDETSNSCLEVESNNHGFCYWTPEDSKLVRLDLGHCQSIDQVGTLPTSKNDRQYGETYPLQGALGTQLDMSTTNHPKMDGQSERTIQTLEDMLRSCVNDFGGSWDRHLPLVEFSYNNSYHASIKDAPFAALYGRPFKVLERVGPVAYKLELPRKLQGIHNTFHVSNLKKCLSDESLIIPLDEIQLDEKLHFIEEPVEIIDREVKRLKQSRIPIVKVR
nr:retrotransposon protein, putative, Ty3-gypsy subclass [Tanacetum cinerariifolium]